MKAALTKRSAGTEVRSLQLCYVHLVIVGFRVQTGEVNSWVHGQTRCGVVRKLIDEFACKRVSVKRHWDRQTGNSKVQKPPKMAILLEP